MENENTIETPSTPKKRWFRKPWFKIIMFIFCIPVWALVVWTDSDEKKGVKILAGVMVALVAFFVIQEWKPDRLDHEWEVATPDERLKMLSSPGMPGARDPVGFLSGKERTEVENLLGVPDLIPGGDSYRYILEEKFEQEEVRSIITIKFDREGKMNSLTASSGGKKHVEQNRPAAAGQ